MHFTPIEIYLLLLIVIPLGVCFLKWWLSLSWVSATGVCAGSSWFYFNLCMMKLDPPDNGFANAVYLVTGWFWLLPIFGLFLILFRLAESRLVGERRRAMGYSGFIICSIISILVLGWNFFGRMSEQRAITEARDQLEKRGYRIVGKAILEYDGSHWLIRYPDSDFGEIRLTRNGRMSWIGSP